MTLSALVPDRPDDLERLPEVLPEVGEMFAFARPDTLRDVIDGDRQRAAARLLAFVAATGLGAGVALLVFGEIVAGVVRSLF